VIELTDRQLQDFQDAVDWETAMRLPDGRVLGNLGKRDAIMSGRDFRITALADRFELSGMRVLELGSHEGNHTVQLAELAREVVAVEVRPKNIVGALVRLFVHDVANVRLVLGDVRDLDASFGRFDLLFHVGVLYHLSDPVDHLFAIAATADALLLDTHYETRETERPRADLRQTARAYEGYVVGEGGWPNSFSGVDETSCWLERASLLRLVGDVGFGEIEVIDDRVERNGHRITLVARKAP
jgi:hypothetical protein